MNLGEDTIAKLEKQYKGFKEKVPVYDAIVSLIKDTELGERYKIKERFTEVTFFVRREKVQDIDREKVKTDLYFYDPDDNSIILVEETFNPLEKENQLRGYIYIDKDSLQLVTRMTIPPKMDVFLIVPYKAMGSAKEVYDKIIDEDLNKKIGRDFGLTLWYYDSRFTKMTKFAGEFVNPFLKNLNRNTFDLKSENYGDFYKTNSIVEILKRLLLIPYQQSNEDRESEEGINLTKEKITSYFRRFGMNNEQLFKEALELGEKIGLLVDVNLNSMFARPAYHTDNAQALNHILEFSTNPILFIKEVVEGKRKTRKNVKPPQERALFYNATVKVIMDWLQDLYDLDGKATYNDMKTKRNFSQPHV